jgi:hypothetical protein
LFFLDELRPDELRPGDIPPQPEARDIAPLIRNANKKSKHSESPYYDHIPEKRLGIRLMDEKPELRWIVTWIYLLKREGDGEPTYYPDWRIQDPFGFGKTNAFLKAEIDNPKNKNFIGKIRDAFSDAPTIRQTNIAAYEEQLDESVQEELEAYPHLCKAGDDLRWYVQSLVRAFIRLKHETAEDVADDITRNIQIILEHVLRMDQKNNKELYDRIFNGCKRPDSELAKIYRKKLFSSKTGIPPTELNAIAKNVTNGRGSLRRRFLSYRLLACMLTSQYEKDRPILTLFKDRIELILEIKEIRNAYAHPDKPAPVVPSVEQLKSYYDSIKEFVNTYSSIK